MARKPAAAMFHSGQSERLMVDAPLIRGFVETFLQPTYDNPHPIPAFHEELWELFCDPHPQVAVAAPRGHAKSTGGNHAYVLANLIFGRDDFAVILSSTERLAVGHLKSIKDQLWDNEELRNAAQVEVVRDVETELVARVRGREFCVMAFGAEANLRGVIWRQRRPSLIMMDDIENDEQVMNKERRDKLWEWIQSAVLPMGSDHARFRVLGTILHMGAALERMLQSPAWKSKRFRAHADFGDFASILWPDKFPEARLRQIRQNYIDDGEASGYSKEYLSHPIAEEDAFFRRGDLRPMLHDPWPGGKVSDYTSPKTFYGAVDFAVEQKQKSDYTVFGVGGMDQTGCLNIVNVRRARLSPLQIIDNWFELDKTYRPEFWTAEEGIIRKVLGPFLFAEMAKRNHFFSVKLKVPVKDKTSRASSFQARCRAGGVKFDKEAEWYPVLENELLTFPKSLHDDQADMLAWLGLSLDEIQDHPSNDEIDDEFYEEERRRSSADEGRSLVTGY